MISRSSRRIATISGLGATGAAASWRVAF